MIVGVILSVVLKMIIVFGFKMPRGVLLSLYTL